MNNNKMSTLHTLNKTAQDSLVNDKLSNVIDADSSVILIENGVYQCLTLFSELGSDSEKPKWSQHAETIYALKEDAMARGVPTDIGGIIFISYEEFVQLSLNHKKVVSWY